MENETQNACFINKMPGEVLSRIFSYFATEDKFLCLELVCKKWKESMLYPEWQSLNVAEVHRMLCRRGCNCQMETNKRYNSLHRSILKRYLLKALKDLIPRCSSVLVSLNISGLVVDSSIATLLVEFLRLSQLNISNCHVTKTGAEMLSNINLVKLIMEGGEICSDNFTLLYVSHLCLNVKYSSLSFELPESLTSLSLRSVKEAEDYSTIFEQCPSLQGFHVESAHSVASDVIVEMLQTNLRGVNLTSITISLHPEFFSALCTACPNVVDLNFRAVYDRNIELDIGPVGSLKKLQRFNLFCRRLSEYKFLSTILRCTGLKVLEVCARNMFDLARFPSSDNFVALRLEVLKLTLDCVTLTAQTATFLMSVSPNLRKIRIMKKQMKEVYTAGHSISDDAFCAEFNENAFLAKNLRCLSLPYLMAEYNMEFLQHLSTRPINKLCLYGGNFYFEDSDLPKFPSFGSLKTLVLGPYFQTLTGLEDFVVQLPNLRRLAIHIDMGSCWNLLLVIGSLENLRVLEIRCCSSYFIEMLEVELIPLFQSRRMLVESKSYSSPMVLDVWTKHSNQFAMSRKLQLEFDTLLIRFKICHLSD